MSNRLSEGSGSKPAGGQLFIGKSEVTGLTVITDGTNDVVLDLHDGEDSSTPVKYRYIVAGAAPSGGRNFLNPRLFHKGVFAVVTSGGTPRWIEAERLIPTR